MARKKTAVISVLSAILIISGFYFGARFASTKISNNFSSSYAKKLNRKIDFGKTSFSFIDGIVISDINIFSTNIPAKTAYSIKKTAIIFKAIPLLKGNLIVSKIKINNAKFTLIREKNGDWDFADIQAVLPKPKDKFYSAWPKQIIAEDSEIFIIDKMSGNMWALENADLKFSKRLSYYGGSFSISCEGMFKGSFLNNSFMSKKIKSAIKANFENNNLNSSIGEIELKDLSSDGIRFKNINFKWDLFEINSRENKQNYKAEFKIEEISTLNTDNPIRQNIAEAFKTFSKIYGKKIPDINELNFQDISAKTSFHKDLFHIQDFKMNSDISSLNADFKLNTKTNKLDLDFKGNILGKEMKITAKGPYDNPHIKPEFSYTLRTKITAFLKILSENIFDKTNGEKP